MKENYQQADWLAQKYAEEKFTVPQIASMSGVSKGTIMYWMRTHRIPRRRKGYRNLRIWSSVHNLEACRTCHSSEQPHHSLGLCKRCYHMYWREKKGKNYAREKGQRYTRKVKHDVLVAYGGNPPVCDCCGESKEKFLQIDYMNGDGKAHRASVGRPDALYRTLRRQGFPKDLGLRVLCANCNFSYGHYGYCPHNGRPMR